jgi:hypothetical protein
LTLKLFLKIFRREERKKELTAGGKKSAFTVETLEKVSFFINQFLSSKKLRVSGGQVFCAGFSQRFKLKSLRFLFLILNFLIFNKVEFRRADDNKTNR